MSSVFLIVCVDAARFFKFDCILLLVIACFETVILFFSLKTDSIFLMFLVFSFFDSIFQF